MAAELGSASKVAELLDRLQEALDCADDSQREMLGRRRKWVENATQILADAHSTVEFLNLCDEIRTALKGGMGSFADVHIYPGPDCEFDEAELNATFQAIVEDIYSNVVQAVDRGDD